MFRVQEGAQFQVIAREWNEKIEERLLIDLPVFRQVEDLLWQQATRTAVFDGGKRIRPLLTILGWQVSRARLSDLSMPVLKIAAAVEFIHCSSLIFDDLPCMDNATMRRGNKALHLEYGEDKAILTALGLLLKGIELVMLAGREANNSERFGMLLEQLMNCVGVNGLICGQWFDLSTKQSELAAQASTQLAFLRNLKTMPLIKFSLLGGAIIGGASRADLLALTDFAEMVGESYQLVDDLLDHLADSDYSGKDSALDLKNDRLNSARSSANTMMENLQTILAQARGTIIERFDDSPARGALCSFTDYLYGHLQGAIDSAQQTTSVE
jgi:geranylgeranyl diphosphate synthase, type II